MSRYTIRPMCPEDRDEVAELIQISLNHWYTLNGKPGIFTGDPENFAVFFDVYRALEGDDCGGVVAQSKASGRLMASCFYHPRPLHVSLGIMNVHPNHWGSGAGRGLLDWIVQFTCEQGKPLRLTSSAINLDSFSLYNRAGFVPRQVYQDMMVPVPAGGLGSTVKGTDHVRDATAADVAAMVDLERKVSGITREQDCKYAIANAEGFWHTSVYDDGTGIRGWMVSCAHPAMNMLGPAVAADESVATALVAAELDLHRGRSPIFLVPVECTSLVKQVYAWGGKNTELHLAQVLGDCQPYDGVNMPSFLPETG